MNGRKRQKSEHDVGMIKFLCAVAVKRYEKFAAQYSALENTERLFVKKFSDTELLDFGILLKQYGISLPQE